MESLYLAFKTILPLFLAILTGALFSRHKSVNGDWVRILNDYALWIGFPALIFSALAKTNINFSEFGNLIIFNSAYIVFAVFLAFPISSIFKLGIQVKRTLFLVLAYGNVSYLGIPVLQNTYGDAVLPEVTMISAVYLFWLFTLCIFLVEKYGDNRHGWLHQLKSFALNPLLLSVFLGIVVSVVKIEVPVVLMKTIDFFGTSVTAVVLFSIGIFLGSQPIGNLRDWIPTAGFSVLILFILPLVFYLVVSCFFYNVHYRSWVLEAAMPMGLTPYVLSARYGLDTRFASRLVMMSTVLAMLSLPLWIFILG
ncbi:MAG: AEC family transporter [Prolixibacteraceae bacterium]|jgi:predicted permease|nr:AEC family transporter [Prolixibacteraceae bacterium]